jgi:excisionase family DNA binding protein
MNPNNSIRTNPPKNLKVAEAAAYIGVSDRTLRTLIAEQKIPVVRIGGRIVLRLVDVDRWLESKLEGAAQWKPTDNFHTTETSRNIFLSQ